MGLEVSWIRIDFGTLWVRDSINGEIVHSFIAYQLNDDLIDDIGERNELVRIYRIRIEYDFTVKGQAPAVLFDVIPREGT